jgi:uncharacterized damage-inducible protein DinB
MDIGKQILQTDVAYSAWATSQLLAACSALTGAEQTCDLGLSHKCLLNTLHHIYVSERFWSECLRANSIPSLHEIGAGPSPTGVRLVDLQQDWPAIWAGMQRWLDGLGDEDLTQTLACILSDDASFPFTRWQLLRHSLNHASFHRGQIVGMLRALGKQPPNVDVMSYLLR